MTHHVSPGWRQRRRASRLVTALRLKAAGTWQPAQLILIYPMLDATASMASYASNGEDYIITRDTLLSGYEMYLAATPATHPDASPLWREDFHGLPPVHILTAEFDPLRDEGEVLYRRLTEQGWRVPVSAIWGDPRLLSAGRRQQRRA